MQEFFFPMKNTAEIFSCQKAVFDIEIFENELFSLL